MNIAWFNGSNGSDNNEKSSGVDAIERLNKICQASGNSTRNL